MSQRDNVVGGLKTFAQISPQKDALVLRTWKMNMIWMKREINVKICQKHPIFADNHQKSDYDLSILLDNAALPIVTYYICL